MAKSCNRTSLVLFSILAGAIVLRIWGIWFGLPHIFHNDEGFEVVRKMNDGKMTVLAYSLSGKTINEGKTALLKLNNSHS